MIKKYKNTSARRYIIQGRLVKPGDVVDVDIKENQKFNNPAFEEVGEKKNKKGDKSSEGELK